MVVSRPLAMIVRRRAASAALSLAMALLLVGTGVSVTDAAGATGPHLPSR